MTIGTCGTFVYPEDCNSTHITKNSFFLSAVQGVCTLLAKLQSIVLSNFSLLVVWRPRARNNQYTLVGSKAERG